MVKKERKKNPIKNIGFFIKFFLAHRDIKDQFSLYSENQVNLVA